MKCFKFILCNSIAISVLINYVDSRTITVTCKDVAGYYWRDFAGEVPNDAVPGGTDEEGKTTYVGLTLHPGASILSGTIRGNEQKMFYEYGGAEHTCTEDIKILCSQHPDQLRWVSNKSGESATNVGRGCKLVPGGHDRSRPLAIGRKAISTGEVLVSKVLTINHKFESIYLAHSGKGWSESGPYEVLVYNTTASITNDQESDKKQVVNINIYY